MPALAPLRIARRRGCLPRTGKGGGVMVAASCRVQPPMVPTLAAPLLLAPI